MTTSRSPSAHENSPPGFRPQFVGNGSPSGPSSFRFSDCEIDFQSMSARRNGAPVILTACHEFKLLKFFTDNLDRVLYP